MLKILSLTAALALSCAQSALAQAAVDFDRGAGAASFADGLKAADLPAVPANAAQETKVFQLRVSGYPAADGPCVESARRIGEALARSAGVEIVSAACENAEAGSFNIVISYAAAEKIGTVTTVSNGSYMGGLGSFKTEQDCRAGLEAEKAVFQQKTGLEPAYAYCFVMNKAKAPAWTMNIGTLGQPAIRPFNSNFLVFDRPFVSEQEFLGGIRSRMLEQGLDVRALAWVPDFGYAMVNATYYSAERVRFNDVDVAKLDRREQCEAMLAEAEKALSGRKQPIALYCGKSMLSDYNLNWVFQGDPSLELVKHGEEFKDYASCTAARGRVSEFYANSMGRKVAGAVCGKDFPDFTWKVSVLAEKI